MTRAGASEMGGRWKAQLVVGGLLSEDKEGPCPSPQPFHRIVESFCSRDREVQAPRGPRKTCCLRPSLAVGVAPGHQVGMG